MKVRRFVEHDDGVGDERAQAIARVAVIRVDPGKGKGFGAECLQDFVVLLDFGAEQTFKTFGVDQIDHAQAGARRFVAVSGPDAAFGGADFVFALENFPLLIELAVIVFRGRC